MIKFFLLFGVSVLSSSGFAQTHSTDDWARQEAFVNPRAIGEKEVESWEGGSWKEKGLRGSYRFIITQVKPGVEKLYVQWLVANKEIAYSMSIKEFNVRPEYDIQLPECKTDNCSELSVKVVHAYEKSPQEFALTLQGLGKYVFTL